MSLIGFFPEQMTDEQIDARLAEEYPPADFDVKWWWIFPDIRCGFAISAAFKHVISREVVDRNIFELQGRG